MRKLFQKIKLYMEEYHNDDSITDMLPEYPEDETYDAAIDLIQMNILGFCGCGMPDDNIDFIRECLKYIDTPYKERVDKKQVLFGGNTQCEFFMVYWMDSKEFTEGGSWLSKKGKDLLDLLETLEATAS